MGKIIKRGSLPPDDPIFSGGPQIFSPLVFRPSSKSSTSDTAGENQTTSLASSAAKPTGKAADSEQEPVTLKEFLESLPPGTKIVDVKLPPK